MRRLAAVVSLAVSLVLPLTAFDGPVRDKPEAPPRPAPQPGPTPEGVSARRVELNLLGAANTAAGESRRNENVQFNLIDNNALKELNVRMGTTATLVEEFRADRNYFGAEFGNRPPAALHAPAAPGAAFHGTLYEWHNNSVFSARSFFQVGDVKPARENHYGFQLGTPPWAGATLALEGSQQKIRGSVNGNVLAPRAGERAPLTSDPAVRRVVERFLAAFPKELPNRPDINERALNTNSPQKVNTDNLGARLDQSRAGRDRLTLRYQLTAQRVEAFQFIAGQNPNTTTRAHTARLTWNRAWSAETVTDFSAGLDRVGSLLDPEPNAVGPSVSFGSVFSSLGPGSNIPLDRAQNRFRDAGQILQVRGAHSLHWGAEWTRQQINGTEASSHRGAWQFRNNFGRDAVTNFLLGVPTRYSVGIGNAHRGFRNWEMQYYAGDQWRVRPALTLSYGLRYQPVTPPVEVDGLSAVPYGCDCGNLAPRFGFAYRLPGHWGALRGAYGLHFGEIFPVTFQQTRFNPPQVIKLEIQTPNLADPLGALPPEALRPGARSTIFVLSPDLSSPYSHQYNFSWEPFSLVNWKLQLGWVGSRSHKLLMKWRNNRAQPAPGIPRTTETINQRRPNPNHFEIRHILNASRAYFDAGRAAVGVPAWRGLSLDAVYWFGKAIDLGGDYTTTASGEATSHALCQSEFLVHQDLKGPSRFDQSHAFLLRFFYALPASSPAWRDWTLSAVFLVKTGTPFNVFTGSDGPGFGNVDGSNSDRPNLLDPSLLGRSIGHPDTSARLMPRSAFAFPAPGESRGNLGAHVFRKAGIGNLNAALARTFHLGADKTLIFRAESINFFNTPQFDEPGTDLTSPGFGQITNTLNDGRTFRLLLRFGW